MAQTDQTSRDLLNQVKGITTNQLTNKHSQSRHLASVVDKLKNHISIEKAKDDVQIWSNKAKQSLTLLPQNQIKDSLESVVDYLQKRVT